MTRLQQVLDRLEDVQPDSHGFKATCPGHDDPLLKLSIRGRKDGQVLLTCLGGCKAEDVLTAIGLEESDLDPVGQTRDSTPSESVATEDKAPGNDVTNGILENDDDLEDTDDLSDLPVQGNFNGSTQAASTTAIPSTDIEAEPAQERAEVAGQSNQENPKASRTDSEADEAAQRPEIVVNGRFMRDITKDALAALTGANDPLRLFVRAGILVRIDGQGRAQALIASSLRGELDRAADHVKEEWKTDENGERQRVTTPARPPTDVANDILALPSLPFPGLRGIAYVPQVLPGGAILARDGYDPETGLLLRLHGLEGIQTDLPLEKAKKLLVDELLGDFPFIDDGSRAHAVAMLLQPFVLPLITGPTPLYLIDAPTRGTGKTLLSQTIGLIVLGSAPPVMTLVSTGDEIDKRITASLLEGDVIVVVDNISTRLASDKLAAVLTTRRYRGRRLGASEMLTVDNDATWVATGNNVEVSDEMARRIMPIRLDTGTERPELRSHFRHADLLAFANQHRPQLVGACLSLIGSWVEAGMPEGEERVGSFESWAAVMGGILAHAGVPGLLGGRERFTVQADRETTEWAALCGAWWQTFSDHPVNASELFEDIIQKRKMLLDTWAGRDRDSALKRIGRALSARRDRVFGEFVIRDAGRDSRTRNNAYRLERESASETSETPGHGDEARQGHETAPGVSDSETPPNTLTNTRGADAVLDGENDVDGVFRVFESRSPQEFADSPNSFEELRAYLEAQDGQRNHPRPHPLLDVYRRADEGEDAARVLIETYLAQLRDQQEPGHTAPSIWDEVIE